MPQGCLSARRELAQQRSCKPAHSSKVLIRDESLSQFRMSGCCAPSIDALRLFTGLFLFFVFRQLLELLFSRSNHTDLIRGCPPDGGARKGNEFSSLHESSPASPNKLVCLRPNLNLVS
jgi:hypothetical protein